MHTDIAIYKVKLVSHILKVRYEKLCTELAYQSKLQQAWGGLQSQKRVDCASFQCCSRMGGEKSFERVGAGGGQTFHPYLTGDC